VGSAAAEYLGGIAEGLPNVKTVGWVPSVMPYLDAARATVVPLRYGAGTKRKVIQALMVGTPTVMTSVGAEGLGLQDGRQSLIADDAASFATGIERLLRNQLLWQGLARRGRRHVLRLHGRATIEARFDAVLEAVLARSVRPAPVAPADAGDGEGPLSDYERLVARVCRIVECEVPLDSKVLVASRGDGSLLAFDKRVGWHFPRERSGKYAGYYPKDSEAAVAHLEELRAKGATHLVLPETGFWWLSFYEGFRDHLEATYRAIRSDETAIVYDLGGEDAPAPPAAERVNGGRPAEAAATNGHVERAVPAAITPDVVNRLQPVALEPARRHRAAARDKRVLLLGVYLVGKPNTAEHVAAICARSHEAEVVQRWIALGPEPADGALGEVTAMTVSEPTPKYVLLNRLLAEEDLSSYDYVLTVDDDIVVPEDFLDLLIGVQAELGFAIAQPARTQNSYFDHPIVLQQRGVLARRTLFVEIGPVTSFGREAFDHVFPFDESNPMGWGFENVWAHRLRADGRAQGIVDGVPVDHSVRAPVAYYVWDDAVADRERYLAAHEHLPLEECFRVLEVVGE
jgi:Glycosyl transferases group 1